MPVYKNEKELRQLLESSSIPVAETAKVAVVRPTTRFQIVTEDNPDMVRTLEDQERFVQAGLASDINATREDLQRQFQKNLSDAATKEQNELIRIMAIHGIPIQTLVEDKGHLENGNYEYYTDQIYATDTGQYFDDKGKLIFIPSHFKNIQRKGEERLAIAQAKNLGATVKPLNPNMLFEGGDIRQMPGRQLFLIGSGHRTTLEAVYAIASLSNYAVLPIELLNEQFYHLDCCFLPLPNDSALIYEGEYVGEELDGNGWPVLQPGTETMTPESRALIRTLYPQDKLVLICKDEALAFATNAALLQSMTDKRFKLFANGDRSTQIDDEREALKTHTISFLSSTIKAIEEVTEFSTYIIELPYKTMHLSGGSVRCTVNEMACTTAYLKPEKRQSFFFSKRCEEIDSLVNEATSRLQLRS